MSPTVCLALLLAAVPAAAGVEESLRESVLRLSAGDVAGARASAEAAAAAAPGDPRAREVLARAALAALDYEAAEAAAARALTAGTTPARLVLRAQARLGRRDFEGALADAEAAIAKSPGGGAARLCAAAAKEGLRRPAAEVLADYRRAAELDASLAPALAEARARLEPAPAPGSSSPIGSVLVVMAVSAVIGWAWGLARREIPDSAPSPRARAALAGAGRLEPRAALAALIEAAAAVPDDARARFELAESLYERLAGAPAYATDLDRRLGRRAPLPAGLPPGAETFFARALDPEPARRFQSAGELVGAFRALADPPVL